MKNYYTTRVVGGCIINLNFRICWDNAISRKSASGILPEVLTPVLEFKKDGSAGRMPAALCWEAPYTLG
jgi:hypothetical protein